MKILYGIQGTGNGHLTRARLMANALQKRDIKVDFFFSGRKAKDFFDMQCFGEFTVQQGLSFATSGGRVQRLDTVRQNSMAQMVKDVNRLNLSAYDLVLNDFEPISAWAAKRQGVPSIGISHQAALQLDVPKAGNTWLNDALLKYFAPVDIALGCHWHHFGFEILPPFVDVTADKSHIETKILVYLPFEDPDAIIQLVNQAQGYQFLVYHPQRPTELPSHVQWFDFSREGFKQHLGICGGVISSAGFELISEALTLGKKLLIKPVMGQFEQLSNLAALQLLGAAEGMSSLQGDVLKRWLKMPSPAPINYPKVGDALVAWLQQGDWQDKSKLCQGLWQQVDLPPMWHKK